MNEYSPIHLAVPSGNVSLFCLIGCAVALEKNNLLADIKCYSSSGNGCFLTVPLSLGCSCAEIKNLLVGQKQSVFHDSHSYQYLAGMQISGTEQFMDIGSFFTDLFIKKLTIVPSFRQLYLSTGKKLYLTSYNVSTGKNVCFSVSSCPDMNVLTAIRLSSGVQLINSNLSYEGDLYVDASFSNPLPLHCFKSRKQILIVRNRWNRSCEKMHPMSQHGHSSLLLDIASERLIELSLQYCISNSMYITCLVGSDELTEQENKDILNDSNDLLVSGYEQGVTALKSFNESTEIKFVWDTRKI
jgi:predicted acylesterase/phospholipase RssA